MNSFAKVRRAGKGKPGRQPLIQPTPVSTHTGPLPTTIWLGKPSEGADLDLNAGLQGPSGTIGCHA